VKSLCLVPLLAACADLPPRDERDLAAVKISAVVTVHLAETPVFTTELVYDGCYSLHVMATVDDVAVDLEEPEDDCAKAMLHVDERPAPRDISTITLADASATKSIEVARLFVNPRLTVSPAMTAGPQIIGVEDPRAIDSAMVWFRSADNRTSWIKPADPSTQGQLRFTVPPGVTGQGTLGVELTIKDNAVTCLGWASCKASVNGGEVFTVTVQ
jgi:hypothetical protein